MSEYELNCAIQAIISNLIAGEALFLTALLLTPSLHLQPGIDLTRIKSRS